jgi:hypothetical protein
MVVAHAQIVHSDSDRHSTQLSLLKSLDLTGENWNVCKARQSIKMYHVSWHLLNALRSPIGMNKIHPFILKVHRGVIFIDARQHPVA